MRLHPAINSSERKVIPFRSATMSTQIVAQVRDALFARELRPGDFLGTEKDLAGRFGVSRIVARDALRTLEAQGMVDIKVGSGGGARIAQGNAAPVRRGAGGAARSCRRLGAARSWMRSAPSSASRPNSPPSIPPPRTTRGCAQLIVDAEGKIDDVVAFTRSSREFHLAVAEASHNRVLVVQLISLQHVSWPARNPTLTPQSGAPHSRRPQGAGLPHRNPRRRRRTPADGRPREDDRSPARRRATRQATQRSKTAAEQNATHQEPTIRERSNSMAKEKFIIEPHFRLQEWVAEEKGYFKDEGLDYVFQELIKSTDGAHHYKGDKVGAMQSFERGRSSDVSCACHWTVGVAASKGKGKLYADVYSVAPSGVFVPPGLADQAARGSRRRADLGRLSVRQPLLDHPGARAIHAGRQDQSVVCRRHAVPPARPTDRRQGAGLGAVQRPLLLRRATRLPQDHRHHVHDRDHGHRRSRSGRPAQVLPRAASARSATSICGPISTPTTTRTNSRRAITP